MRAEVSRVVPRAEVATAVATAEVAQEVVKEAGAEDGEAREAVVMAEAATGVEGMVAVARVVVVKVAVVTEEDWAGGVRGVAVREVVATGAAV